MITHLPPATAYILKHEGQRMDAVLSTHLTYQTIQVEYIQMTIRSHTFKTGK